MWKINEEQLRCKYKRVQLELWGLVRKRKPSSLIICITNILSFAAFCLPLPLTILNLNPLMFQLAGSSSGTLCVSHLAVRMCDLKKAGGGEANQQLRASVTWPSMRGWQTGEQRLSVQILVWKLSHSWVTRCEGHASSWSAAWRRLSDSSLYKPWDCFKPLKDWFHQLVDQFCGGKMKRSQEPLNSIK